MWGPCASADVYWRPSSGGETNKERDEQSQQSQVVKCWRLRKAHLWTALSGWAAYPNTYSPLNLHNAPYISGLNIDWSKHKERKYTVYVELYWLIDWIIYLFIYLHGFQSYITKEEFPQKLLHFIRIWIKIRNQIHFLWYFRWCVSWMM